MLLIIYSKLQAMLPDDWTFLCSTIMSEVMKKQQDAIYAPNINLGSIPNAAKSAFTPIDRRDSKDFSKPHRALLNSNVIINVRI